ncbi:MAG: FliO/MopB family protein [Elusimicrobia bacterium]|nr:FliO/MopB family protein [Elusimicrobiota bacterium]
MVLNKGRAGNLRSKRTCFAFVLWFCLPSVIFAVERLSPAPEPVPSMSAESPDFLKPESPPSFPVVRVVMTLGLLMGALYFARPLLKKTKWGGGVTRGEGLDVLSRVYLGPKAGLCLVQAEGRKLLLGVGADGVRLLADLSAASTEKLPHA